jgi:hypothetical protein
MGVKKGRKDERIEGWRLRRMIASKEGILG